MNPKKTIQINPDFLSITRKKSRGGSRKSTEPLRKSLKPNDIKRKLLARIKQHQHKRLAEPLEKEEEVKFKEEFSAQLDYLQKAITQSKGKKHRKRTRHRRNRTLSHSRKEPPYGCLKNGNKPTFAQYKRTLRYKPPLNIRQSPEIVPKNPAVEERQEKLRKLQHKLVSPPPKISHFTKKTLKIFKLGKNLKTAKIGVLIKCSMTRKKVRDEQRTLEQKPIAEVKQYLRKCNLIKIGSSAPEDVIRRIYEDSFLTGQVYNKNLDNLLHNYLSTDLGVATV